MLAVGFGISLISSVINPMHNSFDEEKFFLENQEINWQYAFLGENPSLTIAMTIIYQAIVLAVAVYIIRRWSKNWNSQFNLQK